MWKKLGYVALSYYSPYRAVMVAIWAPLLIVMWFSMGDPPSEDRTTGLLPFIVMPSLLFFSFVYPVGRLEFARPQARLVPGFALPQLIFLVCILTFGGIILPAIFAHRVGVSITGALALLALIQLGLALGERGWIAVAILFLFASSIRWGGELRTLLDAKHALWHLLIVAAGAISIGRWLYKLTRQEENPGALQAISYSLSLFDSSSHAARKQRRAIESIREHGLKAACSDWWHNRVGRYRSTTFFGRVQLLRYGSAAISTAAMVIAAAMALLLYGTAMEFLFEREDQTPAEDFGHFGYLVGLFGVLLPGAFAAVQIGDRQSRMGSEVLWPMSKSTYVDTLFLSAAIDGVVVWIALQIISIGLLLSSHTIDFSISLLAVYLLLNLSFQILFYGAVLLLALCESTFIRIVALVPLVLFPLIVILLWWEDRRRNGDLPYLVCGLIAATIGSLCVQAARHGWRDMEVR